MNGIWNWVIQLVLLVVATFAFIVLFQYGTADFSTHLRGEFDWAVGAISGREQDSAVLN